MPVILILPMKMSVPFDDLVTFCYTSRFKETIKFYEEVLGLPLVLDQGRCRIYRVSQNGYLGFCRDTDPQSAQGIIITLVTDDVDGWYDNLIAKGVGFEKSPRHNPDFRIYHCFLRDPNGYLIEIQRFEDPKWPRFIRD